MSYLRLNPKISPLLLTPFVLCPMTAPIQNIIKLAFLKKISLWNICTNTDMTNGFPKIQVWSIRIIKMFYLEYVLNLKHGNTAVLENPDIIAYRRLMQLITFIISYNLWVYEHIPKKLVFTKKYPREYHCLNFCEAIFEILLYVINEVHELYFSLIVSSNMVKG